MTPPLSLPDPVARSLIARSVDHDRPAAMYAKAGLDAKGIVAKVFEALGKDVRRDVVQLKSSPKGA